MQSEQYSMSFGAGSILRQESVRLAELYMKLSDWDKVQHEALATNLLQARAKSSAKRICRELCSRLACLNSDELAFLVEDENRDQDYLLWLAICRRYRFIYEFAVEIIRERYLELRYDLSHEDFDAFFNARIEWHEELEKITPKSQAKLRQVLFRMLREAGLINTDNQIIPAILSPRLVDLISQHSRQELSVFPTLET